jgi:hypothetical protein
VISGIPTVNGTFNFAVKVADELSATATQPLSLTVGVPPGVMLQTTNISITVIVGSNLSLAVSVAGIGPFTYQWQLNGTNLSNGIITTVAGNGTAAYSGDGGAATIAELDLPYGVAVDATGNLFIADSYNTRIRKVGSNGIIATVAGNGTPGYSGDGGAATNAELGNGTNAEFGGPSGVAVDATGNLFIADRGNERIRKVILQGPTLVVYDVGFGNAGAYDVVVSNPYGSVTSSVVNLTVTIPSVIISTPQVTTGNTNFTFLISGPSGGNFVLQVSTNLLNWSLVSTSTIPVSGTFTLTNPISGYGNRFYRVQLQ